MKQSFALFERDFGIRVWINENMLVVESADQADMRGKQHAVTEYIPRHVANTQNGKRLRLGINIQIAEQALD